VPRSLDFFFKVPKEQRKWIAAVDAKGYGLLQCSTAQLKGRKLFVWGDGAGGKNWNRYLSDGTNEGYVEIQAGLAYTQLEHIPMPKDEVWSWVEGYGAVNAPQAHGTWQAARQSVENGLDAHFPAGMEKELGALQKMEAAPEEMLLYGSGWGTLEALIRQQDGDLTLSNFCQFPEDALTEAQQEWVSLLRQGIFPEAPVSQEPKGYLVDEKWRLRLHKAMERKENRHWYAYMHLGLMEYAAGNVESARTLMEKSFACKENPWAARNLAMLWKNEYGNMEKAAEYIRIAVRLNPTCRGILLETAMVLLAAGESEQWIALYNSLPEKFQKDGRLQFNTAIAYMKQGKYKEATAYLNERLVMPDIKEGDTAISDVWRVLYSHIIAEETGLTEEAEINRLVEEKYPLGALDFRTH